MKNLNNLQELDEFLQEIISKDSLHKKAILEACAQYIEDEAKRKFGVYQEAVGDFPAWEKLKQSTQDDRVRRGFEPDNPLYRTGDLMHSIKHKVEGNQAVVGSDSDIMVWQEKGTPGAAHPIPARPALGPAAFESKAQLKKIIAKGVMAWLNGKSPIKKWEQYYS